MSEINRIAFIDSVGRICTSNAAGTEQRILTERGRFFQFPAWSPIGSNIASIGSGIDGSGVYILSDSAESNLRHVYHRSHQDKQSPFYLYWSPDGTQISYIANDKSGGIAFYTGPASQRHQLPRAHGQPFFWQWGEDSAEIFVHAGLPEQGKLLILDEAQQIEEGGSAENIDIPGQFQAPAISPSNQFLAYGTFTDDAKPNLMIAQRNGELKVQVEHKGAAAFSWSPTQDQLAFITPLAEATHFYGPLRLMTPTGQVRTLTQEPIVAFFWSPDGKKLAYFTPSRRAVTSLQDESVFGVVYANGSKPPSMSTTKPDDDTLTLELWVIDLEVDSRQKLLFFQPTKLFLNQFIPFFDQYAHSHRLWSPNSDALVVPILQDDESYIMTVTLQRKAPVRIAEGVMGFWSCL